MERIDLQYLFNNGLNMVCHIALIIAYLLAMRVPRLRLAFVLLIASSLGFFLSSAFYFAWDLQAALTVRWVPAPVMLGLREVILITTPLAIIAFGSGGIILVRTLLRNTRE